MDKKNNTMKFYLKKEKEGKLVVYYDQLGPNEF